METGSGPPTPEQARALLARLAEDESAVRYPPLPRWFFLAMSAIVAALCLVRLLPSEAAAAVLSVALSAVAGLIASRYWLRRDGVCWASMRWRDMAGFLVAVVGTFAVCALVAGTTGAEWVWALGAAVAAAVVLGTGRSYRKEYGDAR